MDSSKVPRSVFDFSPIKTDIHSELVEFVKFLNSLENKKVVENECKR